jgi:hypothetical protein
LLLAICGTGYRFTGSAPALPRIQNVTGHSPKIFDFISCLFNIRLIENDAAMPNWASC